MKTLRILVMILVAALAASSDKASAGTLTVLHSFSGLDGSDPEGGLVQGNDGNFYGTTFYGGDAGIDFGAVFRITPDGSFTNLHTFVFDGSRPLALVQGNDGSFYGTTFFGGTASNCVGAGFGCGTVFRMSPSGDLTTLYSFTGSDDGSFPAELVQG